ncbi:nitroreductase family deazaflavin-dependent oxidoreductase [Mycobacteroides franklinii]|uniref:Nitroreductase family deazaflavin-dependent oxidoreductase n=1 Tax=Mycobacteroides franklinii TaxID=948102 RepID=A0A4V3A682_9MYCO|nr:nitroreductase family deazaflavin-dependent oxidoreductase [Mycobacteroides franklinii]ORA61316.1 nitroreductase family deazaflavin-dependent oxidoreductase [Mycobacteroides franklinii]TDH22008.1 nitroreductase family deazaflavin-dependent oxidoreductase [Mycobacteroides franklinii]
MAYLKPPWFVKNIFNKVAMVANIGETLTITKRVSGEPQQIPVATVDVDGIKYVVSTRGESQWVKNIRANPQVTLTVKGASTVYTATEVPVADRAPIIAAYKPKAGKVVDGYFAQLPDDADHPTFALTPA